MHRAAVLLAAAVYAVALALAPTADASRFIRIGIYDDSEILYGNPDYVFPILQQVSTKLIRANLRWGGPSGVANRNPADPAYDWTAYDRAILRARAIGAEVMLSIVGTPSWANGGRGWNTAPTKAIDLRRFAVAAARRYNGTFAGPEGRLPVVRLWLAWNEPNNPVFLKPQYQRVGSRFVLRAARDYARICNSIVAGVKSVQAKARVGCGVTAPRGNNNPRSSRPSSSPVAFLRAIKAAGARGFDAYAHHPYYGTRNETPSTPPSQGSRGQAPTAVTLGNFEVLTKEVQRLYGNVRIWVTEYGYQTNPPDKLFGVTYAEQAAYMREAYLKLRRHPKVDIFIWFLLRDEARLGGWQSGIYNRRYIRKDAREVFEQISTGRIR